MKDFLTKWSPPHVRDCRGTAGGYRTGSRLRAMLACQEMKAKLLWRLRTG